MRRLTWILTLLVSISVSAQTLFVTSTNDSGPGSFRQALLEANANCTDTCTISFDLPVNSVIEPLTPLPPITWCADVSISALTTELSGARLTANAHGLEVRSNCANRSFVRLTGLTINRFPDDGFRIAPEAGDVFVQLEGVKIGTDITGRQARPNRSRGVAVHGPKSGLQIGSSIISGNLRSGFYLTNGSTNIGGCRIGVGSDGLPLGNGASGVFALDGFVGVGGSVIAHNGHWAISLAGTANAVAIDNEEIRSNAQPAIDWGLDGQSGILDAGGIPNAPVITSATFDPVTGRTLIRGTITVTRVLGERYSVLTYADGSRLYPYAQLHHLSPGVHSWETSIAADLRGKVLTAISGVALFADLTEATTSEMGPPF